MVDHWGDVVHDSWPDGSFCTSELVDGDDWHRTPERAQHEKDSPLVPDLDHPGTRAFLLEDVRRAWGQRVAVTQWCGTFRIAAPYPERLIPSVVFSIACPTETAALIAALEAAP